MYACMYMCIVTCEIDIEISLPLTQDRHCPDGYNSEHVCVVFPQFILSRSRSMWAVKSTLRAACVSDRIPSGPAEEDHSGIEILTPSQPYLMAADHTFGNI